MFLPPSLYYYDNLIITTAVRRQRNYTSEYWFYASFVSIRTTRTVKPTTYVRNITVKVIQNNEQHNIILLRGTVHQVCVIHGKYLYPTTIILYYYYVHHTYPVAEPNLINVKRVCTLCFEVFRIQAFLRMFLTLIFNSFWNWKPIFCILLTQDYNGHFGKGYSYVDEFQTNFNTKCSPNIFRCPPSTIIVKI